MPNATERAPATDGPAIRHPLCDNCGRAAPEVTLADNALLCGRCEHRFGLAGAAHFIFSLATMIAAFSYVMPHLLASSVVQPALGQQTAVGLTGSEALTFYLALFAGIAVHEGAHAASARGFGFDVVELRLGFGPVLVKGKLGATAVFIHLIPLGGLVRWRPGLATVTRAKRAAVSIAGPLANLVIASICWSAHASAPDVMIPVACANALLFVLNIAPFPATLTVKRPTDGWHILKNLTNSRWANTHARRQDLADRHDMLARSNRPSEAAEYLQREIELAGGDHPDAEALLCARLLAPRNTSAEIGEGFERSGKLLADQRAFPAWRAVALNNRAYMLAVAGWENLMQEAEWAIAEALRHSPNQASYLGTMALVLVRQRRYEEAESLATRVVAHRQATVRATGSAVSLAANRCTLALAYAHTDRIEAAQRELTEARRLDPTCALAAEVEHVLSGPGVADGRVASVEAPNRAQPSPAR